MIRFIDLGRQISLDENAREFAFFDTVYSRFLSISGEVVFDSYADFMQWVQLDPVVDSRMLTRLIGLMPPWLLEQSQASKDSNLSSGTDIQPCSH